MKKLQTAIGGTTSVPSGGSATVVHESDGGEWINLVAYIGSASGLSMNVKVRTGEQTVPLVTQPDDGPDTPQGGQYPITVPTGESSRFLTLVRLDEGDELVFKFQNPTGAQETITCFASAAGALEVALGNGGPR